ncbi:MAG: hypothetical protein AAGF23_27120, partial [Acidobacteriota bacterium]
FDDPTGSGYQSLSEITKEVLTETYPRMVPIDYLTDDFSDESNWVDHNNCYTATTSGSVNILQDVAWNNGSLNRCFATLKTDASATEEKVADFDLTFTVKWVGTEPVDPMETEPPPPPPNWAGVAFRKQQVLDAPWQSGYLVSVGNSSTITLSRPKPAPATGSDSWTGTLQGDPTAGNGVELTIVARGDWIRVFEGQNEVPVINIVDALSDEDITNGVTRDLSGFVGLATINAAAEFAEPLTLTRVDRQAFGDFFEGYDTTSLDLPWVNIAGFSVSATDPEDKELISSDSAFSSATVDGFSAADARISARLSAQQDGRWGAVQIRKTTNGAMPWMADSGYAAMLLNSSGSADLRLYCKDCPGSHLSGGPYVAEATLGTMPADGHVVDLVAIGDRIQVYVDGQLEIDHWETDASRPTTGTAGVSAAQDSSALHPDTTIDDVFVMEPLP